MKRAGMNKQVRNTADFVKAGKWAPEYISDLMGGGGGGSRGTVCSNIPTCGITAALADIIT